MFQITQSSRLLSGPPTASHRIALPVIRPRFGLDEKSKQRLPEVIQGTIPDDILRQLPQLEQSGQLLSEGYYGITYLVTSSERPLAHYVVKKSKKPQQNIVQSLFRKIAKGLVSEARFEDMQNSRTLRQESAIISKMPHSSALRLVGYAECSGTNEAYLVMSLVPGKDVHVSARPITFKQLDSLVQRMFDLDRRGLYHGDIHFTSQDSGSNVLTTRKNANLIDYGKGFRFDPLADTPGITADVPRFSPAWHVFCPPFALLQNAVEFGFNGMMSYMRAMRSNGASPQEIRALFKGYLILRGKYSLQLVDKLQKKAPKKHIQSPRLERAFRYERLRAEALQSASDDIVDMEAWKLQGMRYFYAAQWTLQAKPLSGQAQAASRRVAGMEAFRIYAQRIEQARKKLPPPTSQAQRNLLAYLDFEAQYAHFLISEAQAHFLSALLSPLILTVHIPPEENRALLIEAGRSES